MELSHVAKTKIIDPQLTQALKAANEADQLDLTGKNAVYILFGDEPEKTRVVLDAHEIPYKESELSHLDEAFTTVYSPNRVEAGKLAKLLEDPLVEAVEPQTRELSHPGLQR